MSGRTELPSGLVTFVFTDIEGSTRLARMLGDDYGLVLGEHRSVMRAALRDFDGVELFTEGDSFFVAFQDARAAVAACVEAQRRLSAHDWPSPDVAPRVRMGMHTGWARPSHGEYASAEVHRAARVAAAAHGGQILCSGATALAVLATGAEVPFEIAAPQPVAVGMGASPAPTTAVRFPHRPSALAISRSYAPLGAHASPTGAGVGVGSNAAAAGGRGRGDTAVITAEAEPDTGVAANIGAGTDAATANVEAGTGAVAGVVANVGAGTNAAASVAANVDAGTGAAAGVAADGEAGTDAVAGVVAKAGAGTTAASLEADAHAGPVAGRAAARPDDVDAAVAACLAGVELLDLGPHRLRGFDDDERLLQVVAAGLERDFPRPRTPGAAVHNLPAPVTPFVGRRSEIAELTDLVGRHRIVTVAGPGGSGKTRLSLAVAERVLGAYAHGVWTIDAVSATTGLAPAMAAALGVRSEPGRPVSETVLEHCAERQLLLVLQTSEAAPAACATLVRRLLARCPRVDVLVTGRVPLGVPGEVVWRIPPLSPADVFALLSERTAAARGRRPGPCDDGAELAEVAAQLEGSPLAVELAAARLRLLSATQLAARLDDPLAALDPVGDEDEFEADRRHDSLAANLHWSYRTLTTRAAALLRRLAVFAGPVDLGTVEWCGADALSALSELADKSLVEVVPGPRYRLSGQVKAYASRQLTAAGDEREARDRHVAWSLHELDAVAVEPDGQPCTVSLTELAPYVGEWQTALRWAATHGSVPAGLRLATALDPWWREHGGAGEGRDLLFRLYRRLDGADVEPAVVAHAHLVHAGLSADRTERTRFLERAERIARVEDDPRLLLRALAGHRTTLIEAARYDDAEQLCREVITEAERRGVADEALPAVVTLAELLWRRDALDEAADLLGAARGWEAGRPEDRGRRTVDWLLGMVALRRRDLVAAHDHLVVALRSRLRHGFRGAAADAVAAFAVRCSLGGDPSTAAVLFGGAEAARGARRTEMFGRFWSAEQLSLRAALGDAAFDAAYADGVDLGFDRIVAMALAVEHPDLADGAARFAQTLRG